MHHIEHSCSDVCIRLNSRKRNGSVQWICKVFAGSCDPWLHFSRISTWRKCPRGLRCRERQKDFPGSASKHEASASAKQSRWGINTSNMFDNSWLQICGEGVSPLLTLSVQCEFLSSRQKLSQHLSIKHKPAWIRWGIAVCPAHGLSSQLCPVQPADKSALNGISFYSGMGSPPSSALPRRWGIKVHQVA